MKEAKLLWETLRSSKCKGAEKEELLNKLMNVVSGNAKEIIFSHSTSRVIQFLVTQKKETIRNELFEELTPEIVRMAKSKYAKFFVAKMLKYGSKHQRDLVLNAFQGHCVNLFKISTAAQLLDTAFNEYANAAQRFSIISEFYGPEYHELGNLSSLKQIAQKQPEKVVPIMQNLENVLENCVIKETLKLSLTHRLLLDYLTYCSKDQKSSIIESMRTNIPEICHTRDGSRAALECIWNASVKDRKAIVKSFKGLAVKSAMDEFARRALFGIFDVVDDTVLVNKIITEEIGNNIAEVVYDKFGVWVLHYLVHPRDGRVLGKGMMEILSQGDSNEYSQKPPSERYTELFNCIRTPLYTFLAANMKEVITNKISSVLVLDALEPDAPLSPLKKVIDESDKQACFAAIAQIVGEEFIPNNIEGEPHIIESGCQRFVFRKLLQCDANQEDFIGVNSGCFALVDMLRSGSSKARTAITNAVSLTSLKNSTLVPEELQILHDAKMSANNQPQIEKGQSSHGFCLPTPEEEVPSAPVQSTNQHANEKIGEAGQNAKDAASNLGAAASNIAEGSKDKVVAGAEAVGEKAAEVREGIANAAASAGEAVANAATNAVGDVAANAGQAVATAATNVKDGVVNAGAAVAEGAKDVAKGTGNVVGKGLESAGQAIQSNEHPEAKLAAKVEEKTDEIRQKTEEWKEESKAAVKSE
uniref:PUM-HD domain-containing protein n=1 Tax=Ditylenchus dipsaci TaxID=166011 RepID=A0A915E561_9BILA